MRDFFKSELETLYAKTQLRQYETLSAMVDAEGKPDGIRQIRVMIDSCVATCANFPEIPDTAKQSIILKAMIEDGDFKGFSAPWVWKVLNAKKDAYIRTQANFQETDVSKLPDDLKPVSDERRDFWLAEWSKALEAFTDKTKVERVDLSEIKDPMIARLREEIGSQRPPRPKFWIGEVCPDCKGSGRIDSIDFEGTPSLDLCPTCESTGQINAVQIQADNEAEARKAYDSTFK